jgi:hypothetical protein
MEFGANPFISAPPLLLTSADESSRLDPERYRELRTHQSRRDEITPLELAVTIPNTPAVEALLGGSDTPLKFPKLVLLISSKPWHIYFRKLTVQAVPVWAHVPPRPMNPHSTRLA